MIFSLAGVPPLIGFFPKWVVIQEIVSQGLIFVLSIFLLMASVNFYIYNRLIYSINLLILTKNDLMGKRYFYYFNFIFPLIFLTF